jgi:hypothetical protein
VRKSADVHHTAGLDCIDCHTALEVMGSGQTVAHRAQALRVRCEDYHAAPGGRLASQEPPAVDPESRKILSLRGSTDRTEPPSLAQPVVERLLNVVRESIVDSHQDAHGASRRCAEMSSRRRTLTSIPRAHRLPSRHGSIVTCCKTAGRPARPATSSSATSSRRSTTAAARRSGRSPCLNTGAEDGGLVAQGKKVQELVEEHSHK